MLVNNAGANWGEELESYPDAAFSKVLTLNLQRVFTLTQKLVPLLLASLPTGTREEGPWEDPGPSIPLLSSPQLTSAEARIINIGSVDGIRVPSLETYAYSASKAGLHQLSRVFASQLGKRGITSNTLACGTSSSFLLATPLIWRTQDRSSQRVRLSPEDRAAGTNDRNAVMAATLEAGREMIIAGVPLGRIGTPQDVAGACIFLSSRAGAWVNG